MNILALVAGTLCVLSNGKLTNCTPTTEALIKLQPAAESRRLVWTSDDGKRMAIVMVPNNAPSLDLSKLRDVALRISGDPARGWPADVRLSFSRDVFVTIPAKSVAKLTTLSLVPARYNLGFGAEHYVGAQRTFDLAAQKSADLGEVRLRPLPLLTATVVTPKDGKDVPLSGADVSFSGSAKPWIKDPHVATSDEKGVVRAELPEASGEAVVISHAGLASKTMRLDRRDADQNLGVVRLVAGVTLTVKVVRPPKLREKPLTVALYREDPGVYETTRVADRQLAGTDDEVAFDEVGAGKHLIVVQGAELFERMSVPVTVDEGKAASAEVRIEPYTLAGRATFGGDPLDSAKVSVYPHATTAWRVELTTAADGTFGGTAWQHGVVGGSVNDPRIGGVFFTDSPELGADPSVWNVDIKKRLITGRVYDAATKEPLAKVELFEVADLLDEQGHKSQLRSGIRTDDSGNFKVMAAKPGRYELRFARPDYLPKSVAMNIGEEDGSKEADFAVERGTAQTLVLRWPDGEPVASATIYDGDAPEPGSLPPTYRSDASGTAKIRGRNGEVHTLYVLPVEGSIAVVHLPIGGSEEKAVEAVVGRPSGAIRIVAVDPDGKPTGGGVALRLNGDLIPLEIVMRRYGPTAGFSAGERVLDRLPPGMYEVWVVWTRGPLPPQPSARVGISAGEERVQVTVPKP